LNLSLQKLIDEGEHQKQDFKFCINDSKKIAKSLVAFANTDGGRLLIGVKDNGKIVGISTDEEFYMVESAAKLFSKPPLSFTTKQWISDDKIVLEITVRPSTKKPHYALDENGKWMAYSRINDENVLVHKIQLLVWKKQNSKQGIYFSYTSDEKSLIDYLAENRSISFAKFIRLAHISRKKAEEILSNFVLMNVIKINSSRDKTEFSLNPEFDLTTLSGNKSGITL
jgi:predicted HTH transcriptional regulator